MTEAQKQIYRDKAARQAENIQEPQGISLPATRPPAPTGVPQIMYEDPTLPEGWQRRIVQRPNQSRHDCYIFTPPTILHPEGTKLRTQNQLRTYLLKNDMEHIDPEEIDFSVYGSKRTHERIRQKMLRSSEECKLQLNAVASVKAEIDITEKMEGSAEPQNPIDRIIFQNCHLPKLKFKLIEERKKFDFVHTREALTAALATEGFGRVVNRKRYKMEENRPSWYDSQLEQQISVPWSQFLGVNTPQHFRGAWKEALYAILKRMYTHYLGESVDRYLQTAEEAAADKLMVPKKLGKQYSPGNRSGPRQGTASPGNSAQSANSALTPMIIQAPVAAPVPVRRILPRLAPSLPADSPPSNKLALPPVSLSTAAALQQVRTNLPAPAHALATNNAPAPTLPVTTFTKLQQQPTAVSTFLGHSEDIQEEGAGKVRERPSGDDWW